MAQAAKKGMNAKQAARYTFGTMNNLGAMHGNQVTPKGEAMEAESLDAMRPAPRRGHPHRHKNLGKYLHPRGGYQK